MFLMGSLRLGSLVKDVSNAVITGFVTGASLLILVVVAVELITARIPGAVLNWKAFKVSAASRAQVWLDQGKDDDTATDRELPQ